MSELLYRLNQIAWHCKSSGGWVGPDGANHVGEAAEEIARLRIEQDGLRTERDAAIARAEKCEADWDLDLLKHTVLIRAERDAAQAERDRFREALQEIAGRSGLGLYGTADIAAAALKP